MYMCNVHVYIVNGIIGFIHEVITTFRHSHQYMSLIYKQGLVYISVNGACIYTVFVHLWISLTHVVGYRPMNCV